MTETRLIEGRRGSRLANGLARTSCLRLLRQLIGKATRLILIVALTSSFVGTPAQAQGSSEYAVKAAFLYNFTKFVEWPSGAFGESSAPLIVGVLGQDPFGGALDQILQGKTVNGRPVLIQRLTWGQNLRACHILFICQSERKRLAQILSSLRGMSVLTISEIAQFNQQGGIINFVIDQNKVRFEINMAAAEQGGLKISSRLLSLAKAAKGGY